MGKKISLGRMALKKVTKQTVETEDETKTTFKHQFESVDSSGKFNCEWWEKLDLRIGQSMELVLADNQSSIADFEPEGKETEKQKQVRKGKENQKTVPADLTDSPPKDVTQQTDCKFHSGENLCGNSSSESPWCIGEDCEVKEPKKTKTKTESKKKSKSKTKSTKSDEKPAKKGTKEGNESSGDDDAFAPVPILKKTEIDTDALGGLKMDVQIEYNEKDNFYYAHAISRKKPTKNNKDEFCKLLKQKTGLDWAHITDNTFSADQNQLKNLVKE